MNRRRLLKLIGLPALAIAGGAAYVQAKTGRNPYYSGPVTDHFDGVRFSNPPGGPVNDRIDDAHQSKYHGSPYLRPMIGPRARSATVWVMPRDADA